MCEDSYHSSLSGACPDETVQVATLAAVPTCGETCAVDAMQECMAGNFPHVSCAYWPQHVFQCWADHASGCGITFSLSKILDFANTATDTGTASACPYTSTLSLFPGCPLYLSACQQVLDTAAGGCSESGLVPGGGCCEAASSYCSSAVNDPGCDDVAASCTSVPATTPAGPVAEPASGTCIESKAYEALVCFCWAGICGEGIRRGAGIPAADD